MLNKANAHRLSIYTVVLLALLEPCAFAQRLKPDDLLSRVRAHMAANLAGLPNYVCMETIERSRRPVRKDMTLTSRLRVEVAHVSGREMYSWPGAEQLGETHLATLAGGGMFGTGFFSLRMQRLFTTTEASIRYVGAEKWKGRSAARFDYRVPASAKWFLLAIDNQSDFAGENGSFWVDTESLDVVRMKSEAIEIPGTLGIRSSHNEAEYGRVPIANSKVLLPLRARSNIVLGAGEEKQNVTVFSACRKYAVESTLSFDLEEPKNAGGRAPAPLPQPVLPALPARVDLALELITPIDFTKSMTGDAIDARLAADGAQEGLPLVPAGSVVHGRLLRLELLPEYANAIVVVLSFGSIESRGQVRRFSAEMTSFDRANGITEAWPTTPRKEPGTGYLFLSGRRGIPAGFHMTWRTTKP